MQRISCLQNYTLIRLDSSPYIVICFKNQNIIYLDKDFLLIG